VGPREPRQRYRHGAAHARRARPARSGRLRGTRRARLGAPAARTRLAAAGLHGPRLLRPLSGAIAVALPISLLLGWISFRLIEQPGIRWSRRTRRFGANDPAVSSRAPRSARTARGRRPSTARASG
jgi:hypothetical protein